MNDDVFGHAISDFYHNQYAEDIVVKANDFDNDHIPVSYLFRTYDDMPEIEQKALDNAFGNVLDVGCGAGSHSLFLQDHKNLPVTAIDVSEKAIDICKKRGIENASVKNFFDFSGSIYNTILLLMNGSGIIGTMDRIDDFFIHIKSLLAPKGQILMDSSDLSYLFEDDHGGFWIDTTKRYYGEMRYSLQYKNYQSRKFDWLYIDYNTLKDKASNHGFLSEMLYQGTHYDYLCKLTLVP